MKGRYGVAMNTYGHILPGASRIARIVSPSKETQRRLKWLDHYHQHKNARLTCRYFGITPKTLYKWLGRSKQLGPKGLESVSRKPHTFRQSQVPHESVTAVIRWRTKHPEFSKYKLATILKREDGIVLSPSTIGRLLVKHRLFFPSPIAPKKVRYRRVVVKQRLNPYYRSKVAGELIEADMKHVSFFGQRRYFFVGIDCITKRIAVHVGTNGSSRQASRLLERIHTTFPYPIQQLRVDNGSENLKDFITKAEELGIKQYFTRPHRPKDKPFVERVIGTIEREFIQQGKLAIDLTHQRQLVDQWVHHYNTFRPHQSLNNLTPEAFERTLQQTNRPLPMS